MRAPSTATPGDAKRALWYLRKVPLLEGLRPSAFDRLLTEVEVREIPRRQVVYLAGDPAPSIYLIHGGRVKISKVTRDGKELTLAYRGAGQIFGELACLSDAPREEMAEAMKNAIISEVSAAVFRELLEEDAALALRLCSIIAERRRSVEAKLEALVFKDVTAKLAGLLLELADEYGVELDEGIQVGLKITHQEMANLIGSTRETISLTLAQFKKRGLVDVNGRNVTVVDRIGLTAFL